MINGKTIQTTSELSLPQLMPETLLRTKLHPPLSRTERVPRPHLLERLDQSRARKLALICAPAGFGKTTLLCEWLKRDERSETRARAAWLALDDEDNDPARFWSYFIAALETLDIGAGTHSLDMLRSTHGAAIESILGVLINEVAAARDDVVLILDDYHVVESPAIHEALAFFLEHLPPRMHLLIASRSEPPLPLARLRANEQLLQLHASDLRFDVDETIVFFKDVMRIDLSASVVQELACQSEGWVAGLQMAALALQTSHGADAETFAAQFGGRDRYIADYLAEEVWQRQPEALRDFLLSTSILERFNAGLCSAVLGWDGADNAQALLETVERLNLFIVSLDRERGWYRYHHLFADFLRRALQRSDADRLPELHRRASAWFEQSGSMDEAIRHALSGADVQRAASLIERCAEGWMARGEVVTIQKWLTALPEPLLRERAELCTWFAWTLALTSRLDEVEPYLSRAEESYRKRLEALRDRTDEHAQCYRTFIESKLSEAASIHSTVARYRGDLPRTIAFAQEALKRAPRRERLMRSIAAMNLGQAHLLSGNIDLAGQALYEAETSSRAVGHAYIHLSVLMYQARLRLMQGRLHRAADIYQRALLSTERLAQQALTTLSGVPRVGLGDLQREWNELDQAISFLSEGMELSLRGGDFNYLRDGYIALARVKQAQGRSAEALEDIERAEQLARRSRTSQDIARVAAWRVRIAIAQGDVAAAVVWAKHCDLALNSMHDRAFYLYDVEYLTLARVWIAQGGETAWHDTERLLMRMYKAFENAGHRGALIEVMLLQALAAHAQGRRETARDVLCAALTLAEPEGYVRLFVDEGFAMRELLRQVIAHDASDRYAGRLLKAFGEVEPLRAHVAAKVYVSAPDVARSDMLVERLSVRETDILRHLALGMPSREIAQALLIAVSTVRWHTKNIYGKLGVRNRTEAALAARGLGILDSVP